MALDPMAFQIATTLGYYNQCVDWLWNVAQAGSIRTDGTKENIIRYKGKAYSTYSNLSVSDVRSMRDNPNQTFMKNNTVINPIQDFGILELIEDTCNEIQGAPMYTQDRSQAEEQLTQ